MTKKKIKQKIIRKTHVVKIDYNRACIPSMLTVYM